MTGEVTEAEEPNGPTGAEVPEGSAEAEVTGAEITGNSAGLSESIERCEFVNWIEKGMCQ